MCISNGPAIFSNTKGYVGRTKNNTCVLAYQMDAQCIGDGLRAIILQIPAKKIIKIHDTSKYNNFLNEIFNQTKSYNFDQNGIKDKPVAKMLRNVTPEIQLQQIGMYQVVVLDTVEDFFTVHKHLDLIVEPELVEFYEEFYKDYKFLVATFDNKIPMSAQPFMVEYEALIVDKGHELDEHIKEYYFFPALDNGDDSGLHSGLPTVDQSKLIREDHFITFPHPLGADIKYSQGVPLELISNKVGFYTLNGVSPNGDFFIPASGEKICKVPIQHLKDVDPDKLGDHPYLEKKPLNCFVNW